MKRFLISLAVYSALIAVLDACWMQLAPANRQIPHTWMMLLFFTVITLIFHLISMKVAKGRPQAFIRFYMGSTALRMFLYSIIVLGYKFYDQATLIPFALGFMAHYFLFTFFEVPVLLKALRQQQ